MLVSVFSIAATAKINDEEDSRLVLLAGKFYKVYESNEVTGDNDYLMSQVDYVALKMSSITGALGGYSSTMESTVTQQDSSSETVEETISTDAVINDDTVGTETSDKETSTPVCDNGVCYTDSVLDEKPEVSEETVKATVFDDEETIAFFEANTDRGDTSIDDTEYPYAIKTKLDEEGVENTIWTVTTEEGNKIYLNVLTLESGKELKAFTFNGKPREVTTLSEGKEIMAKRLLCKTCNLKRSFGVVETISK